MDIINKLLVYFTIGFVVILLINIWEALLVIGLITALGYIVSSGIEMLKDKI